MLDINEGQYDWATTARPGGYRHIALEEGAVVVQSFRDHLWRPRDWHHRAVQMLESAALVGALRKGCSSSRRLNSACRRAKVPILVGARGVLPVGALCPQPCECAFVRPRRARAPACIGGTG